jgi:hypothetical protein
MAVRRPLKINSDNNLEEMSDAEIDAIKARMISLWGSDPSVTLSVVGSSGNLGDLTDQRLLAGRIAKRATEIGAPNTEVAIHTVTYSRIEQTIDSSVTPCLDSDYRAYPVYMTDSNHVQAMNDSDFEDTFITPVINSLTSSTITTDGQAGTYFVSSTNLVPDADLVSNIPVFVDTLADADAFTSGPIPEDSDQFIIVNSYYLHKLRREPLATYENFVLIDSDEHLREMNDSDNDHLMKCYIKWAAVYLQDNKLRYSYDSGNTRGTAMIDTILDSDNAVTREGEVLNEFAGYDYQEVPAGGPIVNQTHYLRISKV